MFREERPRCAGKAARRSPASRSITPRTPAFLALALDKRPTDFPAEADQLGVHRQRRPRPGLTDPGLDVGGGPSPTSLVGFQDGGSGFCATCGLEITDCDLKSEIAGFRGWDAKARRAASGRRTPGSRRAYPPFAETTPRGEAPRGGCDEGYGHRVAAATYPRPP